MKTYYTLVLTLFAITLYAQDDNYTLPFVAYWSKGDVKHYKITKIKRQYVADSLAKEEIDAYISRFEILDSTENSYSIEMTYEQELASSTELSAELSEAFKEFEDLTIRYKTDELGAFQEVTNMVEIQTMMNKIFDVLLSKIDTTEGLDIGKAIVPIRNAFTTPEGIEVLLLKEIVYFHFPFGAEYDIEAPIVYEDKLPNAFGGEPFKAIGSLSFENVDYDNYTCRFIHTLRIDPDASKDMIIDLVGKIIAGMNYTAEKDREAQIQAIREEFADMKYDINDYNEFEYEYDPGWPILIKTKRTIQMRSLSLNRVNTEEIWIELVKE